MGGGGSARPSSHIGSCHSVLGAQSSGLVAHCAVMSTQIRNHYLLRNLHSFESLNFGIYLFVYKRKCIADISHYRHYIGVGDGHHLHDVLHFFETAKIASLKIQKHRSKHRIVKQKVRCFKWYLRFQNPTVLGILKLNRQTRNFNKKEYLRRLEKLTWT